MTEELGVQTKEAALPMVRGGSLFFDVAMFEHIQRVAQVFASSTMVPQHFQKNIPNCVIALNLADRMGVDPFMLFQNMYIVHGNPGIEAKLAIALTNGCGRFEPLQFKHENKEGGGDNWNCIAFAKDLKSGKTLESAAVSIQMAKDEGWYGKSGSKWKTMPELMLEYRSAMFFARVYCPEVLLGLKTREEIYDIVDLEPGRNGTYGTPEQKAADLTEKIKEKPDYKATEIKDSPSGPAQDLKDKLKAGDKEVEGYSKIKDTGEDLDPDLQAAQAKLEEKRRVEQEGNAGNNDTNEKPDMIEWLRIKRPSTSVKNAKEWMKTYREFEEEIDFLADHTLTKQLQGKKAKTIQYLKDNEPPTEAPPEITPERMAFEEKMRGYMAQDEQDRETRYHDKLKDLGFGSMDDVKGADEEVVLGFMAEEFGG